MTRSRKIFILTLVLLAVTVVSVVTRPTTAPGDASRLEMGDWAQPCWRGIRPGETTLDEAEAILREDAALEITRENDQICGQSSHPFLRICADAQATTVTRLNWIPDERVFLADAVAAFGEPFAANLCGRVDTWHSVVFFNGNVIVVAYGGSTLMNEPRRLAPDQRVEQVLYYIEGEMPPLYAQDAPPWRGYGEVADHSTCMI